MAIQEFGYATGRITPNVCLGYYIYLNAGSTYQFTASASNGSTLDTAMQIYSQGVNQLLYGNDSNGSSNAQITFKAATSGIYFIIVGAGSPGSTGDFRLSAAIDTTPNQTIEYQNNINTIGALKIGDSINSIVDFAGDHDWFKITLQEGTQYRFNLSGAGSSNLYNSSLALRDMQGNLISSNENISSTNLNSEIIFTASKSGDYFLDASGYWRWTGSYQLSATEMSSPSVVTSVSLSSSTGKVSGTLNTGDTLYTEVDFSNAVVVAGHPTITLNIGGSRVEASYDSGSGSKTLFFKYTIQTGQTDTNGISIDANGISLASGSILDMNGKSVQLSHSSVADNGTYKVDTTAPTASVSSILHSDLGTTDTSFTWNTVTTDHTIGLKGNVESGCTVYVYDGSTLLGAAATTGDTWSYTTTYLANGDHNINIHAIDSAGNVSNISGGLVKVDQHWSTTSGWGSINVLSALNQATGVIYSDTTNTINPSWGINQGNFDDAWHYGYTGNGVTIALIDTGLDFSNKDITAKISRFSYDFVNNDTNANDENGHGTLVASEIAALNNGIGITGAAYDSELMILKALDSNGIGNTSTVCTAVQYAVDHGADIINMSLAGSDDVAYQTALQYALDHNVLVIMAAGNNGNTTPLSPAIYAQQFSNCIAVGATQCDLLTGTQSFASFSNQAGSNSAYNYVDASGVGVYGYGLYGGTYLSSGTSMAAPYVTSEAAILLSANSSLNATQIAQAISGTTQVIL